MAKNKIVVVLGPTATGKTRLAIHLAKNAGGEIVNADSMQIYSGLTIGTAAPTNDELGGVPCHLAGFVPPERRYSVAEWLGAAGEAICDIAGRGKLPVVCGGTGLYLKSLVEGVRYAESGEDAALAQKLENEWHAAGGEAMLCRLAELDPERAAVLHLKDKKRILRALHQVMVTGKRAAEREAESRQQASPYHSLCIGLAFPQRAVLYGRINQRVDAMLDKGLLGEAKEVWLNRARYFTAAQAIGYKEFFPYFDGTSELTACTEKLKQATRNYAKRQLTWFTGMEGIHWLDAQDGTCGGKALALLNEFMDGTETTGKGGACGKKKE